MPQSTQLSDEKRDTRNPFSTQDVVSDRRVWRNALPHDKAILWGGYEVCGSLCRVGGPPKWSGGLLRALLLLGWNAFRSERTDFRREAEGDSRKGLQLVIMRQRQPNGTQKAAQKQPKGSRKAPKRQTKSSRKATQRQPKGSPEEAQRKSKISPKSTTRRPR